MKEIRRGEFFIVSNGEYSDYSVYGLFKATQDINIEEEISGFLKTIPIDDEFRRRFSSESFINWLTIKRELAEEIKALEFWTTSYSFFTEKDNWSLEEL